MSFVVTPELTELAVQARRAGLGNGVDFYIRGVPFSGTLGTDLVGLSFDGNEYCVEQRGPERTAEVLRTPDFTAARARFLTDAEFIAARYVPRRQHRPEPDTTPETTWLDRRALVLPLLVGLGFLAGFVLLPLVIVFILFMTAAGNWGPKADGSASAWRGEWDQKIAFGLGAVLGVALLVWVLLAFWLR